MANCYCKDQGVIHDSITGWCDSSTPCRDSTSGEVVQCCGGTSTCGSDGFCFFTGPTTANITGYYLGGCTDPNFEDPACPQHCTEFPTQDVVYNPSQRQWSCCQNGDGQLNCGDPSDESFSAPAPDLLAFSSTAPGMTVAGGATAGGGEFTTDAGGFSTGVDGGFTDSSPSTATFLSSVEGAPTSTFTAFTTAYPSSQPAPPSNYGVGDSPGLGPGIIAVIVIFAVIGALIIPAGIYMVWRHRRDARRGVAGPVQGSQPQAQPPAQMQPQVAEHYAPAAPHSPPLTEHYAPPLPQTCAAPNAVSPVATPGKPQSTVFR